MKVGAVLLGGAYQDGKHKPSFIRIESRIKKSLYL